MAVTWYRNIGVWLCTVVIPQFLVNEFDNLEADTRDGEHLTKSWCLKPKVNFVDLITEWCFDTCWDNFLATRAQKCSYIARIMSYRSEALKVLVKARQIHYQLSRYKFGTERYFAYRGMRKKVKLFRQFYQQSKTWLRHWQLTILRHWQFFSAFRASLGKLSFPNTSPFGRRSFPPSIT